MNNIRSIILVLGLCLTLVRMCSYYNSTKVNNTDLEKFVGKWGAPREQFYFAKIDNGLSMSIYRSSKETLIKSGGFLMVKDLNTLEYVENAGGKLFFKDGKLVFDYWLKGKEKLLFTFYRKKNNTYYFTAEKENVEHELILSINDNLLTFDVVSEGYQEYLFRGDKMNY